MHRLRPPSPALRQGAGSDEDPGPGLLGFLHGSGVGHATPRSLDDRCGHAHVESLFRGGNRRFLPISCRASVRGMTVPSLGSLAALGIDEAEERVYRFLLRAGPSPKSRLQDGVDAPSARLTDHLRGLESKGLVSRSAHQRPLYVAVPPELALEGLFARRYQELERARATTGELIRAFRQDQPYREEGELVEIVSGRDAITERALQLERAAKEEVLIFDQPPYAAGGGQNQVELELLKKGIRYRAVYDHSALEWPGQLELLAEIVEAGEEARATPVLPMKLTIYDRWGALLPLRLGDSDTEQPERIIVHPSTLLDALVALFEMFWERATPIDLWGDGPGVLEPGGQTELSAEDRRLLTLLVSGLKDDAIGRQLSMGRRTVQRRLRSLIEKTGTMDRHHLIVQTTRLTARNAGGEEER